MTDGLAMGNPLSPILSDIYMHYFEVKLFSFFKFPFYTRYVDDSFVLIDLTHYNINVILDILNSIDPFIQFTFEIENQNRLAFLDVLVIKEDTKFLTTVYRKPFSVSLPPHFRSNHPPKQKLAAFNTLIFRAHNICSNKDLFYNEINYIKAIAVDRGFPCNIVDRILLKFSRAVIPSKVEKEFSGVVVLPFCRQVSAKISRILNKFNFKVVFSPINKLSFSILKDPINLHNSWGIYRIYCECGLSYIGQTRRSLKCRLKEHESYVKKQEFNRSTIAKHCWSENHRFNFSGAKIIKKCSSVIDLDFYESFYIHKFSGSLVNDIASTPFLSPVWNDLA